jgi:hypothetical protein
MKAKTLIKQLNFESVLIFFIIIGISIRILNLGQFAYGPFEDRDLYRGVHYFLNPYFHGPEFSDGGSTPGGGLYQLIYIVTFFFGKHPLGLNYSINFLHIITILFAIFKLKQILNKRIALLSGAYLASSYMLIEYSQITMNPTLALPFLFLFIAYLLELILNKQKTSLLGCFACGLLASQMHFSCIVLLIIIFFNIIFLKIKLSFFDKMSCFSFFLLSYFGYFLERIMDSRSPNIIFKDLIKPDTHFLVQSGAINSFLLICRNFFGLIYPSLAHNNANIDRVEFLSRPNICHYAINCNHTALALIIAAATSAILFFSGYYIFTNFTQNKPRSEKAIFISFLISFLLSILIFAIGMSEIADFRRHIFLIPFISLLFSFGVNSFQKNNPKLNFLTYSYIALFFIFNLIFVTITGVEKIDNYGFKKEIVNTLQTKHGFSPIDLKRKVTLIAETNNNLRNPWLIYGIHGDAGYDLSGLEMYNAPTPDNNNILYNQLECVIVFWPTFDTKKEIRDILSKVKHLPSLEITKIEYGKKANYVFYKPWDSQCMGYYRNLYVYNKWDNLLFETVDEIADDSQILKKINKKSITLFFKKSNFIIQGYSISRNIGTMSYMIQITPLEKDEYQVLGYSTVPKNQRYGEASDITFNYSASRIKILLKKANEDQWQEYPLINSTDEIKALVSLPIVNKIKFRPGRYSLKLKLDDHTFTLSDQVTL